MSEFAVERGSDWPSPPTAVAALLVAATGVPWLLLLGPAWRLAHAPGRDAGAFLSLGGMLALGMAVFMLVSLSLLIVALTRRWRHADMLGVCYGLAGAISAPLLLAAHSLPVWREWGPLCLICCIGLVVALLLPPVHRDFPDSWMRLRLLASGNGAWWQGLTAHQWLAVLIAFGLVIAGDLTDASWSLPTIGAGFTIGAVIDATRHRVGPI
jgi:hypothetical protein